MQRSAGRSRAYRDRFAVPEQRMHGGKPKSRRSNGRQNRRVGQQYPIISHWNPRNAPSLSSAVSIATTCSSAPERSAMALTASASIELIVSTPFVA
jgi:hypothetical protein